jgi:nickel/cobalt transporter (NicO) family protein
MSHVLNRITFCQLKCDNHEMPILPGLDQLLRGRSDEPFYWLFSLLIAFFLGAAHALTPGHGKTLVAAYLAGTRGRMMDAIYLGGVVTVTHTASVFFLGGTTLWAAQFLPLHRILPVLAAAGGLLVTVLGIRLIWARWRGETAAAAGHGGGLISIGVSGGLVPCPEALVVLLLAVSMGRVGFGLALLAAFTLGLAAVLVAIGCGMVWAGKALQRVPDQVGANRWLSHRLPLASAVAVTVLGLTTLVQAFSLAPPPAGPATSAAEMRSK